MGNSSQNQVKKVLVKVIVTYGAFQSNIKGGACGLEDKFQGLVDLKNVV